MGSMTGSRPRTWFDLSPAEGQAILETYLADRPSRVLELLATVRGREGPVDRLDYSRESLGVLWGWVLDTFEPRPTTDAEIQAVGPPWWYPFQAPLGQMIGPDLVGLVSPIGAYLAEAVIRRRPDSVWERGRDRNGADFNQPLLHPPGRGAFCPDVTVLTFMAQWSRGRLPPTRDGLVDFFDLHVGPAGPPGETPHALPFTIDCDGPRARFVVAFEDDAAHHEDERIEALVRALARVPGIRRANREDREVVVVDAPGLTEEAFRELVARFWETTRGRHKGE